MSSSAHASGRIPYSGPSFFSSHTPSTPFDRPEREAPFVSQCVAYAALGLIAYDALLSFKYEWEVIWRLPRKSHAKWCYLSSRYLGIAVGLCNTLAVAHVFPRRAMCPETCRYYNYFQMAAIEFLLFSLEIVLVFRLYAMYSQTKKIKIGLICLLLCEKIGSILNGVLATEHFQPDLACVPTHNPKSMMRSTAIQCGTQFVIISLTLFQHRQLLPRANRFIPLIRNITRDACVAFAVLLAMEITVFAVGASKATILNLVFSMAIAGLSVGNCRLIMGAKYSLNDTSGTGSATTTSSSSDIVLDTLAGADSRDSALEIESNVCDHRGE